MNKKVRTTITFEYTVDTNWYEAEEGGQVTDADIIATESHNFQYDPETLIDVLARGDYTIGNVTSEVIDSQPS